MVNKKQSGGVRVGWLVAMAMVAVALGGMASALHASTLCRPWPVVAIGGAFGAVAAMLLRKPLGAALRIANGVVAYIVGWIFVAVLTTATLYAVNYFGADKATTHSEPTVVEKRYSETRHRSKRIRRNVYGKGEPYKVYFLRLRFENGRTKSVEVPLRRYNATRTGDTVAVAMSEGALGLGDVFRLER